MKTGVIIFLLTLLASCSSSRIDRKIDDVTWDGLADESYLRWGENRLEKHANKSLEVVSCYKGDADETLAQYRKDYEKKDDSPYYWLHVGNCYFVEEKWTKAEFFYRMALEETKLTQIKSIALNNLGLISFKYGQWEKGKEYLKQSMALGPRYKVPRYNISQLYLQFGHYDRAIAVLSESAFKGHKDIDVFFSLANAHLFKGDLKTAGEYFANIPKESFRREDIAATYALYLIRMGDIEGARTVIKHRESSGVREIASISAKIEKLVAQKLEAMKAKQE